MNPQKVIDIAVGEVGYLEKSKTAYLHNPQCIWYKLDGAGYDNITKYAYEIDRIDWYAYGVQYQPWCATFVDWCFIQAYGEAEAARIKNHGATDCLVDDAIDQYKAVGRWYREPKIGDQIFFAKANGVDPAHTGLVVDLDDDYVWTAEGNTLAESGVVANGGAVARKCYLRRYYRILGYGRPFYDEEDDMNIDKLITMLKNATPEEKAAVGKELDACICAYRVALPCPEWGEKEWREAIFAGITDGTRPMTYATRLEAGIMVKREGEKE